MRAMHDPKVPNYGSIYLGLPSVKQLGNLSFGEYWKRVHKLLLSMAPAWSSIRF
jgi:hypothetical protein